MGGCLGEWGEASSCRNLDLQYWLFFLKVPVSFSVFLTQWTEFVSDFSLNTTWCRLCHEADFYTWLTVTISFHRDNRFVSPRQLWGHEGFPNNLRQINCNCFVSPWQVWGHEGCPHNSCQINCKRGSTYIYICSKRFPIQSMLGFCYTLSLSVTFLNMLPLIFFSREVENVGEYCQASAVSLCRLENWLMIAYIALFSAHLSRLTALACDSTRVTSFL